MYLLSEEKTSYEKMDLDNIEILPDTLKVEYKYNDFIKVAFENEFNVSVYHLDRDRFAILIRNVNDKRIVDALVSKKLESISNNLKLLNNRLVIYFNLITAIFSIVLGIIYFIIVVSLFISSIGKVKTTPFGFHTIQ